MVVLLLADESLCPVAYGLVFLHSRALELSSNLSLRGRTWRRLEELSRCRNSTWRICSTFAARQQEVCGGKYMTGEGKAWIWACASGARGSAELCTRSRRRRPHKPSTFPWKRCDVSNVADSIAQILAAPGLPFPRLRGWCRFVFSAGGDVH